MMDFIEYLKIKPEYTQYGSNFFRVSLIVVLSSLLIFFCFLLLKNIEIITVLLSLICFFFILIIRFPRIHLYKEYFVFEKLCLIELLSERTEIRYSDISKIEFEKASDNILILILMGVLRIRYFTKTNNYQSDRIVITTTKKEKIIFDRIGSKSKFEITFNYLIEFVEKRRY